MRIPETGNSLPATTATTATSATAAASAASATPATPGASRTATAAATAGPAMASAGTAPGHRQEGSRPERRAPDQPRRPTAAPALRTDARRNLRHVLDAARDVFGEQGYDAPIEEVARRARVGVGTVYRRFPNKDALVQFIAEQETQRLTDRALQALAGEEEPWPALEGFVRFSAEAGTGRLLPQLFAATSAQLNERAGAGAEAGPASAGLLPRPRLAEPDPGAGPRLPTETRELLAVLGRLVERARDAGQLRPDATVADVMLVIATAPPVLADPVRQTAASDRLLDILLQGLRPTTR